MRLLRVAWLRPLLRNLTSQQQLVPRCAILATNSRLRNDCNGEIGFGCARDLQVRWRSTVGVVELGHGRDGKIVWETLPDVQHGSVNQTFEHGYGTLLSCPGGISVDLEGELVFISDTSQNRIIVMNTEGKVLDQIGSVAGFEDGSFESGKLQKPTSTIYDPDRSCLLIADSENHAIRRADLVSRTLETVYPLQDLETPSLMQRLLGVLGLRKSFISFVKGDNGGDQKSPVHPWHLVTKHDGHVLAATKGFEKLWNIDVGTGEAVEDPEQETDAIFKKFMKFKFSDIRGSELDWVHVHDTLINKGLACEGFLNLVSRVTTLKHQVLVLDSEMHQLLKMDLRTGEISTMELSNLGLLGFPAQWSSPVNYLISSSLSSTRTLEGLEYKNRPEAPDATFQVRPGRCLICLDVALPRGTILAEPVTDECLWRQGRGSVVELSIFGGKLTEQTVSAAQQYLDDLHSLEESQARIVEETTEEYLLVPKQSPTGLPFYSNVDIGLGTGEVLLDAVIYLKRDSSTRSGHTPEIICNPSGASGSSYINSNSVSEKTSLAHTKKWEDFADGALMVKHLNLRVKFEASEEAPLTRMILLDVQL